MVQDNSYSLLMVEVKSKQHLDPLLMKLKESVLTKINESFSQRRDDFIRYRGDYVYWMLSILKI